MALAITVVALAIAAARPPTRLSPPTGNLRHVVDARRKPVSLPAPLPGVLLLFPPQIGEYFLATAAPDSVAATTTINRAVIDSGVLVELFPSIRRLSHGHSFPTPHSVGLETAMRLRPGAIYIMGWLAPPLDAIGLPTVAVASPNREEAIPDNALLYNAALGREERGETLRRRFDATMAGAVAGGHGGRPSVLDLTVLANGALRVQGPGSLTDRLITRAGGTNVVTRGITVPQVSAEHILSLAPDVILLSANSAIRTAADFAATPPWSLFQASRHRRVYRHPNGLGHGMGGVVETPLELRWLAEVLHPETTPAGLRVMARETYRDTLGTEVNDDQLDRALALAENRGMAGYDRFAGSP